MTTPLLFGLGLRLLALVYIVAFVSLRRDLPGLAGARGVYPVGHVVIGLRSDFGWRRFFYAPSLLHFAHSDRALRLWPIAGITAAALAFLGVPGSNLWFLVAWAIYLSLDLAVDLFYPWDALLLEAGFLALFAPPLALLPLPIVTAEPHPVLSFAFRLLSFRVVFGFGKYKFFGPGRFASGYLRHFLVTQPMPRPLGLWATRLPLALHQVSLAGLFVVEVVLPWLWLGPAPYRLVASAASAALMLGIQLTGNFGFFNIGLLPILLIAAAPQASAFDLSADRLAFTLDPPHVAGVFLIALGLIHLPFNSWVARSWMYWPSLDRIAAGALRPLLAVVRAIAPFRLIHAYGVFSPLSGPSVQWVPVFEGSRDGIRFEPYRYRYYPSDEGFRGVRVAPAFPRFDHSIIYEAMGLGLGNLFGSVVGGGRPHRASRALYFERVARRLLEGSPEVISLFDRTPFGSESPAVVRVRLQLHVWNGERFTVHRAGVHLPEMTLASVEPLDTPPAEAFLFDDRLWTRRALGRLDPTVEIAAEGASTLFAGLTEMDANELLCAITARSTKRLGTSDGHLARQELLRLAEERRQELREVERSALRLAWLLRAATFPLSGEGELELGMRCLRVVIAGERALQSALDDPRRALAAFPIDEAICAFALFRPSWILFHARKSALREVTLRGSAVAPPSFAPGILRINERLAALFPDPTLRLPKFVADPVLGFALEDSRPNQCAPLAQAGRQSR